jgi:hypothetical protein
LKEFAMADIATSGRTAVVAEATTFRYLEWGPMILGALGATAISVVLLTFGVALGLTAVSPYPYAGISAKGLAVLSATYSALVLVASFGAGGYLAGRLRRPWAGGQANESHFRDGAHGFGVWALGVVAGAAIGMSGASAVVKTAIQSTTTAAAAGTAGAASNPAAGQAMSGLSMTPTDYAADRLLAPGSAAGGAPAGAGANPAVSRSELAATIARAFLTNLHNPQLDARDRTMLAQMVGEQRGLSQGDAEKRVDDAFAEFKTAEQKVRDAAERARKVALIAAFAAAATLAVACAAACAAAGLGARHRVRIRWSFSSALVASGSRDWRPAGNFCRKVTMPIVRRPFLPCDGGAVPS